MPYATNDGCAIFYKNVGSSAAGVTGSDAPHVAFVGDIGFGAWQWGWQHAAVAGPYRSIVYDHRGIGRSDTPDGPYSISTLVSDLEAVLSAASVRRVHLVGCGLGGMVALAAGLAVSRVRSVTVIGTSATGAAYTAEPLWAPLDDAAAIRASTRTAVADSFPERQPDVIEQIVEWRSQEDASRNIWEAQRAAIEKFDCRDRLYERTVPTLVIHGGSDEICPPGQGAALGSGLPRGEYEPIPAAGHLAHIDHSRVVNDRLVGWLEEQSE